MIVERKWEIGCDCPRGNFYCETMGCYRGRRTRTELMDDSLLEKLRRAYAGKRNAQPLMEDKG